MFCFVEIDSAQLFPLPLQVGGEGLKLLRYSDLP